MVVVDLAVHVVGKGVVREWVLVLGLADVESVDGKAYEGVETLVESGVIEVWGRTNAAHPLYQVPAGRLNQWWSLAHSPTCLWSRSFLLRIKLVVLS